MCLFEEGPGLDTSGSEQFVGADSGYSSKRKRKAPVRADELESGTPLWIKHALT